MQICALILREPQGKKISDGLSFAFLLLQGALWALEISFSGEPG